MLQTLGMCAVHDAVRATSMSIDGEGFDGAMDFNRLSRVLLRQHIFLMYRRMMVFTKGKTYKYKQLHT